MLDKRYTILVNTTDSFEDCWQPFFTLFARFWPGCSYPIVLNTETKTFTYSGLDIRCARVGNDTPARRLTWSECLLRCLESIDDDLILYLQEDYFLNDRVDVEQINEFADILQAEGYSHIALVSFSNAGPWRPTKYPLLWEIDQKAAYRLSLQAGLWRKDRLQCYLRKHETPWQFEVWGSKRAHRIKDKLLCVNHDIFGQQRPEIVPYKPTGIVKGKWNRGAVYDLFQANGIVVDYAQRGFFDPAQVSLRKAPLSKRVIARLRSLV